MGLLWFLFSSGISTENLTVEIELGTIYNKYNQKVPTSHLSSFFCFNSKFNKSTTFTSLGYTYNHQEILSENDTTRICSSQVTPESFKLIAPILENDAAFFIIINRQPVEWVNDYIFMQPIGQANGTDFSVFTNFNFTLYANKTEIIRAIARADALRKVSVNDYINYTFIFHVTEDPTDRLSLDNYVPNQVKWIKQTRGVETVFSGFILISLLILWKVNGIIRSYIHPLEDDADESSWKLVHGEVFRRPIHGLKYAVAVDGAVRLFLDFILLYAFRKFKIDISFSEYKLIFIGDLFFSFISGALGGFCLKQLENASWIRFAFEAHIIPTFILYLALYFNIFIPNYFICIYTLVIGFILHFLGCVVGIKWESIPDPMRTNGIPRQIVRKHFYSNPIFTALIVVVLMTCSQYPIAKAEYGFRRTEVDRWKEAPFQGIFLVIFVLYASVSSIIGTYMRLSDEDYNWWGPSFYEPMLSGLGIVAVCYQMTRQVSQLGEMISVGLLYGLIGGGFGFISSIVFVYKLFNSLKME